MKNSDLNKKEIKKEIHELFEEGKSKQETYIILTEKHERRKEIADLLKGIPSVKSLKKYRIWDNVLLLYLLLTVALWILGVGINGLLICYALLIYVVFQNLVGYYIFISMFSALILVFNLIGILSRDSVNLVELTIMMIVLVPTIILSLWLRQKLCPPPIETQEIYMNSSGQQRSRINYEFLD